MTDTLTPIPVTKRYLNSRKMRTPEKAAAAAGEMIADWSQLQISTAFGTKFRRTQRIRLVRPGWMPRWLYHRLMASIVVDWVPEERA